MTTGSKKVPINAGSATPRVVAQGVVTKRRGSSFGPMFLALLSVSAGVASLLGAQRFGLLRIGEKRPVTSTLFAQAVAPLTRGGSERVAQLGRGTRRIQDRDDLSLGYSISRTPDGAVQIEAQLEDRASGEVLERFVTWRRR